MTVEVTLLYAGLFGALMAILSIRVPIRRGVLDVPYGDGGDEELSTRIRAFGNFTEYVPMMLVLLGLLELSGTSPVLLHGFGATLLGARVLHAVSYRGADTLTMAQKVGRGLAAMVTWLVLVGLVGAALLR